MTEYELYIPLYYNDGHAIEHGKLARLKRSLVDEFGGLTHFPQENEGLWKVGSHTFRDRIIIYRVLSNNQPRATQFFSRLKEELKREWKQQDVLIVSKSVTAV